MTTRERRIDRARRFLRRALAAIGDELREGRLQAGLTQQQVAAVVGISHGEISRIERGVAPWVRYETLVLIGAVVGLDVPLRAYPSGEPIRDGAQVALLARLRLALPASLRWRTEVPLAVPGDRRAWDGTIDGPGWRLPVEAESRLRDVQAWSRRAALKRRDDRADAVLLLVSNTRHNRHILRLVADDLASGYPVPGRVALATLAAGGKPEGSAIVLL